MAKKQACTSSWIPITALALFFEPLKQSITSHLKLLKPSIKEMQGNTGSRTKEMIMMMMMVVVIIFMFTVSFLSVIPFYKENNPERQI